jgi:hypothetical protein
MKHLPVLRLSTLAFASLGLFGFAGNANATIAGIASIIPGSGGTVQSGVFYLSDFDSLQAGDVYQYNLLASEPLKLAQIEYAWNAATHQYDYTFTSLLHYLPPDPAGIAAFNPGDTVADTSFWQIGGQPGSPGMIHIGIGYANGYQTALNEAQGWAFFNNNFFQPGVPTASWSYSSLLTSFNAGYYAAANVPAVPAVPETESYAMFLAGLGLMGLVARRRRAAGR